MRALRALSRRQVVLVAATLVLLVWAGALAYLSAVRDGPAADRSPVAVTENKRGPFRGSQLPEGIDRAPAPDFRLTDARGGEMGPRDLRGRPYVVTFLYTECKDVCPLIAAELDRALEQLGPRARDTAVLAVSADPRTDTRPAVRRWLAKRRLPANFHYLIGSRRELKPVWDDFYAAPQRHGDPNSSHSASIWLVDARGRLRTKFSGGAPVPPADIAHDLRVLIREADRT